MRSPLVAVGLSLALANSALSQQTVDPQRMTLAGLRNFAVYARVQLSNEAALPAIDASPLKNKMEERIRSEGMTIVQGNDVRDGPGAHLSLLYLVLETKDRKGRQTGFAAFSCIQAEQTVSVTRLGRYAYAVVPTWRSCGVLTGNIEAYKAAIEQNVDEQIDRFLQAWRSVNAVTSHEPRVAS